MIQRRMRLKMNPRILMDSNYNRISHQKEDMKSPEKKPRPQSGGPSPDRHKLAKKYEQEGDELGEQKKLDDDGLS